MSDPANVCAVLAAARIQAAGGRPLTEAEIDLCALEALLLAQRVSQAAHGSAVAESMNPRVEEARAKVASELLAESLQGTLPQAKNTSPSPRF